MAMGLPDLVVSLAANTGKLKKGLTTGQSMMRDFASGAKSVMAGVGIATGLASVAVYGLSGRIAKLAGIADEATKSGLSGEFLQKLHFAADQSGVSVETLTGAAKKLTIAIGNGSAGFKELGLDLRDLQRMSPDQQFMAVAEKISKIPTAAGRASAAMKVFGRSGVEMTGLFAGGMKDLSALMKEAADRGLIISEADLKRAAMADDAIQKMKASFGALVDKVAVSFAPALESVANKISDWMTPVNKFMDSFNAMPEKWKWLGDTLAAAFDVAFETITVKFVAMIQKMIQGTADFGMTVTDVLLNPASAGIEAGIGALQAGGQMPGSGEGGLAGAEKRLSALMQQLNQPSNPEGIAVMKALPKLGGRPVAKGSGDLAGLFGGLAKTWSGPLEQMKDAAANKLSGLKGSAMAIGSSVAEAFTGDVTKPEKEKEKTQSAPRLAGAMEAGGAEAYSAIAQAMLRGSQNPVVKATEKQTKELIKGLKPMPPVFTLISEFAGAF